MNEVIEFLYNDLACTGKGSEHRQTRRLLGVGVSLGASVLGLYAARSGDKNRLDAAVSINCHFDTKVSSEFLATKFYGFYDYALGYFIKDRMVKTCAIYDKMCEKKFPERIIGDQITKPFVSVSRDIINIAIQTGGWDCREKNNEYSGLTGKLHQIQKPFFFLSSTDDQFFGPGVIPYDEIQEHIFLGVSRRGGHVGYIEGGILPSGQWHTRPTMEFLKFFSK